MMTWSGSWLSFYTTFLSTSIFHSIKGRFYCMEDEKSLTFLSNEFNPYRETCPRFVQAQKTFPTPIDQQKNTVCLFYKPLKIFFTGDHLLMTETGLNICERYNKCSGSLGSIIQIRRQNQLFQPDGHS
nr:uncharacterized protein LOC118055891 [Populus alba]